MRARENISTSRFGYMHLTFLLFNLNFFQLFFIQACQGDRLDGGVTMGPDGRTETDSAGNISYSIPIHADFLIAYSTIPGEQDTSARVLS